MQYIPNNSMSRLSSQLAALTSTINQNKMRRLREAQMSFNAHRAVGDPRMFQDIQDMNNTGFFSRLFADDAKLPYEWNAKDEKSRILLEGLDSMGKKPFSQKLQELEKTEQLLNDVNNQYGWAKQRLNPAEYGLFPQKPKSKGRAGKLDPVYFEDGSGEKQLYKVPTHIKDVKAFLEKETGGDVKNVRRAATVTGAGYESERYKARENQIVKDKLAEDEAKKIIEPHTHFYGNDYEAANNELFQKGSPYYFKKGELHKIEDYEKRVIAKMEKEGCSWMGGDPRSIKSYRRKTTNIAESKPHKERKVKW